LEENMAGTTQTAKAEWYPLPKAALAAGLKTREVNRVFDENLLPPELVRIAPARELSFMGCAMARFYFKSSGKLAKEERIAAMREIVTSVRKKSASRHRVRLGFVSIDFSGFIRETKEAIASMDKKERLVVIDPEILGGTPVFRGTRIPIHMIASASAAGNSDEEIIKAFPAVDKEMIALAVEYAKANPRRGRKTSQRAGKSKPIHMRTVSLHA
jgi:uncharacterized protein (DUF433 family)